MKDPQKHRIKELEKKLKEAELKVYDKLLEVTNRELDADQTRTGHKKTTRKDGLPGGPLSSNQF